MVRVHWASVCGIAFNTRWAPYLFVAPFLLSFGVFGLYPLLKSAVLSFYITAGPGEEAQRYVGTANFRFLLADGDFQQAVWNTSIFAFFSVVLQLPLSLGLALLLNRPYLAGRGLFRLGFFAPHLVGTVFVALMFERIFAPNGLLNSGLYPLTAWLDGLLPWLGLTVVSPDQRWLGEPSLVMPSLVLTGLWLYVGFNMIYFLAALQAVDQSLYEAAQVDGAGPVRQFWHVTLPGIKHVALFVVVLTTIGSFQLFELPYLLLGNGPGPGNRGLTVVMYLYQTGFVTGDLGYASAIGWTLVAGVLLVALGQLALGGTWRREA